MREGKLIAVTALPVVLTMQGTVYATAVTKASASVNTEERKGTALRGEEAARVSVEEITGTTRKTSAAVKEDEPPTRIYMNRGKEEPTLYAGHQVIGIWTCNIGTNSALGKKQVEDDRTTPGGEYYICLRNPKSNHHLSLGLSYLNKSDVDHGFVQGLISKAEKDVIYAVIGQGGCPYWKTALGGHMMIRGNKPLVFCVECAQGERCLCDGKRAAQKDNGLAAMYTPDGREPDSNRGHRCGGKSRLKR